MNSKDKQVFDKIMRYADEASKTLEEYGNKRDDVLCSSTARNALSMCVLQVGELVGLLHYETI